RAPYMALCGAQTRLAAFSRLPWTERVLDLSASTEAISSASNLFRRFLATGICHSLRLGRDTFRGRIDCAWGPGISCDRCVGTVGVGWTNLSVLAEQASLRKARIWSGPRWHLGESADFGDESRGSHPYERQRREAVA